MQCQCCGTVDHRHHRGPVTVFSVEGLCAVCRAWFIGIGIESNINYRFWGLKPLKPSTRLHKAVTVQEGRNEKI